MSDVIRSRYPHNGTGAAQISRRYLEDPLQVLHVGKYYPPHMGGIETHLETLCTQISSSVDVSVMVSNSADFDEEELIAQVPVTRVARKFTLASAPFCPGMVSRLRASKAEIVHVHLPNPTAVLAYLASGHPGKLVVTYHSDTVRQQLLGACFEPFLHRFLRRSDAIIATSNDYLRTSEVLAHHRDRCHVVPLGIRIEQFANCNPGDVSQIRDRFGDRLIVAVGRLVYYKGFDYLIQAMTRVRGRLLVIGEGPLRGKLEALVASCGLSDRVHILGHVDDVAPYYHAAEVFVLPSIARSEAFGIAQLEAMAAGTPVVNTALDSGVPFVSQNEVTGLTVPPKDSDALAAAITRLLDDDKLRDTCSHAARLRARSEFSMEMMADRTQAIYESVAGRTTRKSTAIAASA